MSGAFIAEGLQVAATFGWVAVYSHLINPGQPLEVYQRYAQAAGPYVSIFAGAPIFYLTSRWLARSVPTGLALFAVFLVLDGTLLVFAADALSVQVLLLAAASYLTKLGACYLGGRHGGVQTTPRTSM